MADFVAGRRGEARQALVPQVTAHCALGTAVSAYEAWLADGATPLREVMDSALRTWLAGPDGPPGAGPRRARPQGPAGPRSSPQLERGEAVHGAEVVVVGLPAVHAGRLEDGGHPEAAAGLVRPASP